MCGGDGSIGWVLSELDKLDMHKQVRQEMAKLVIVLVNNERLGLISNYIFIMISVSWASCLWERGMTWLEC